MITWLAAASAAPSVTNPRPANEWVSDAAGVIDAGDERALNARLEALYRDADAEIVVVTVASVGSETPKDAATALFEQWGVGDREANNGALVLLVVDARRVEIEVGYGLEPVLPDSWVGQVIADRMIPGFKAGDYGGGLVSGVAAIDERLRADPESVREGAGGAVGGREAVAAGVSLFTVGALCAVSMLLGLALVLSMLAWRWWVRKQRTCEKCDVYMPLLDEQADDAHLTPGQIKEEQLGSVDWQVHQCPQCQAVRTFEKGRWFSGYSRCPQCRNKTKTSRSETLRWPTQYSGGLVEVTESCAFCSHHRRYRRHTPPLPRVHVSSGGRGGGGFGGGGFGGFGGGGGGGGSFGGGRSGGGGAGGSW